MSNIKIIKPRVARETQDLETLSKEELIARIQQLESHVTQLRNLLKPKLISNKQANKSGPKVFDHKKYNPGNHTMVYAKRHVLLQVAYVGWDYAGFVVQEHTEKTIEAELFKALEKTRLVESRETSNYHRCGRTDKGVSSFGQAVSLDLRSNLSEGKGVFIPDGHQAEVGNTDEIAYVGILNKVLPPEIRVVAWAPVNKTLSARFDCRQRTYHYYFPMTNLDIQSMRVAAKYLIGEHDFRNFCKMDVGNGVIKFHRRIMDIQIEAIDNSADSYSMIRLELKGQAFLWHQVRCIVAILFLVGQGKEEAKIIQELLNVESNPRKPQYGMASEVPLNLFSCTYSDEDCQWIYDAETLKYVISGYQMLWTENMVKATMLREMLDGLEKLAGIKIENQLKGLVHGIEPKTYLPLMKRQKCESLEERINAYAKRQRIEVTEIKNASA
uniref:EOG090X083V n=1 Tax=Daphnia similis TaxID=35528 RepID=A0A4Y7LT47_9CRUS|nr:EOG090X083V [Daphnia similis]SVE71748.1 EOG090X083V [Daphnia similis]SVE72376.1 EOG090X083V [Daphnia similis]